MLRKEQRQQAENMRAELAPIYKKAANLAKVWQKKAKEERTAESLARVWQYRGQDLRYCENLPETQKQEEATKAAKTYEESRRAWHEELEKKYKDQSAAENSERAAYYNYLNYLYYICELVADKLRPFAWDIFQTRGDTFKEWAEIIQPERAPNYNPVYVSLYLDHIFGDSFCLDVHAWGSLGGKGARVHFYYKKKPEEPSQNTKEPRPMTADQYKKRKITLESYTSKAEKLRAEQVAKAKEWGMLDACEVLKYPQTEKAR